MTGIAIEETRFDVEATRRAQRRWALRSLRERRQILRNARYALARDAEILAAQLGRIRGIEETEALVTEVLPLLDAFKFLERRAQSVLRSRSFGRWGGPLWLMGSKSRVDRVAHGVVLIIGPSNYPLLLPGVQWIQALVAGNAAVLKPAPGTTEPLEHLRRSLLDAGAPESLMILLRDTEDAAMEALGSGPDLVSFTGSSRVGRRIQTDLSKSSTPSLMELSGCDAMIIDSSADVDLAAKAWVYGVCLNHGRTCIAPRRIIAHRSLRNAFLTRVSALLTNAPETLATYHLDSNLRYRIECAARSAWNVVLGELCSDGSAKGPLIVEEIESSANWSGEDWFEPVSTLQLFEHPHQAIELANGSAFGLGASIFCRDAVRTQVYQSDLEVGAVTINDLIIPLADPRLPFGGCRASGFGVTRGAEGLLAMTRPKVTVHGSKFASARFVRDLRSGKRVFRQLVLMSHAGTARGRLKAAWGFACEAFKQLRKQ